MQKINKNHDVTIEYINLGGVRFEARPQLEKGKVYNLKLKSALHGKEIEVLPKIAIIATTKNTDLFGQGKTCAIIDVADWVGHENEEYFIVTCSEMFRLFVFIKVKWVLIFLNYTF